MANKKTASPFDFSGPSAIGADRHFRSYSNGLTHSQMASRSIAKRIEKDGISPGSIVGLSKRSDIHRKPTKEAQATLRAKK